ncbi:endoplasmic reticulum protein SC65 [Maylandia zebra]|uniref:Endoplasmic reticulum protein SC65 n=4 Tax=Haplochromini TaxID=319058 RepID=A0A3Q2UTA3_HAPBU|nr:endoplasmic reticulum protein SC65 [Maylandia zebra]XP_005726158.1 PREDICTED: synaptonemal complex protein SC65 [Pundamilia nyererei]XP_005920430.1 endoplasmic reticulum protein SC65 [Haplochromis burtoni]XP_026020144.1 endoplasmic reticulum protein SC65 [Astatotilapia calliptera]
MLTRSLFLAFFFVIFAPVDAQYEKYSFKSFPQKDIMPLESAYNYAMEQYGAQNWAETIKFLELSLRLHRLLRDSEAFCCSNCSSVSRDNDTLFEDTSLRVMRHILLRAACLKKCKADFPVFKLTYPRRDLLETFEKRIPYRYIQYAYFQLNNLEKAVAATHTFLKKNPDDVLLTKNMNYYKTLFDVEEYLIDHEEQPYESVFLKSVTLYNNGDFSNSARNMEQAITQYFEVYNLCLAGCDSSYEIVEFKDFYPSMADLYINALKCKFKCEENLTPSVGGFFVEKFVATMYHYLQFSYYKLNDVKNAAPCAASYMLFDPKDQVMQQNVAYYRFYREQWGLNDNDFEPRPEALRYFNQTTKQKEMLEFALSYLQTDDEEVVSPEEMTTSRSNHPDTEFEGMGDYEESLLADWWQEPKTKWDTGEVID